MWRQGIDGVYDRPLPPSLFSGCRGHRQLLQGCGAGERHPADALGGHRQARERSEEHTSELQSLMRISYAVFCLKKKKNNEQTPTTKNQTTTPPPPTPPPTPHPP